MLVQIRKKLSNLHFRLEKEIHPLRQLSIELTLRCNLKCKHCYAGAGDPHDSREITFAELQKCVTDLKKLKKSFAVSLTGGEPLLHPEIFPILEFLNKAHLRVSLTTNATLIDLAVAQRLRPLVKVVAVSLDGPADLHNLLRGEALCFSRTLKGIHALKAAGFKNLVIKTAVSPGNLKALDRLAEIVEALAPTRWHLFPVEPLGRAEKNQGLILSREQYQELCAFVDRYVVTKRLKLIFGEIPMPSSGKLPAARLFCNKRCRAGIDSMALLAGGEIVSCIGGKRCPGAVQGNIRQDCMRSVWENGFKHNRSAEFTSCSDHYFEGD